MMRTATALLTSLLICLCLIPAVAEGRHLPINDQFVITGRGDQIIATTTALQAAVRETIDARIQARHPAAFQVPPPEPPPNLSCGRTGTVFLDGQAFRDAAGVFKGFGATYMSALYWERADRGYLQRNLDWLSERGVNYIRILTAVGDFTSDDFWRGREVDPRWDGYFAATFNDLFVDLEARCLRAEVVLTDQVPALDTQAQRFAWLDRLAPFLEEHREQVQFVEVSNESHANADNPKLTSHDLAELTRYWKSISDIPVAPSSPGPGTAEESIAELFRDYDLTADLLTPHFDRDRREDGYRPHRQAWEVQFYEHVNTHVFTNNEGIGCGSSVSTDCDPARLAMGMANTFVSRGAGFVFHTVAGVRGDLPFWELPNAEPIMTALRGVMALLPDNIANGATCNTHWDCHPYEHHDQIWPSTGGAGVVRAFCSHIDGVDMCPVMGMRESYFVTAKRRLTVEVFDARDASQRLEVVELDAGQDWTFTPHGDLRDFIHRIAPR